MRRRAISHGILDTSIDPQLESGPLHHTGFMSRDTLAAVDDRADISADGDREGMPRDALIQRLADVERAYGELLQRVRRYERERAEIRQRLSGILAELDGADLLDTPRAGAAAD